MDREQTTALSAYDGRLRRTCPQQEWSEEPILFQGGENRAQREKALFPTECSETPAKLQTRSRAWCFLGGGVVLKPRVLSGFWS